MKYVDLDWTQFLVTLKAYLAMPVPARLFFVEHVKPSKAMPRAALAGLKDALVGSGLMAAGTTGVNFSITPESRDFSRAMRGMHRSRVFAAPSPEIFKLYLQDHLVIDEIMAFVDTSHYDFNTPQNVFLRVCTVSWVRQFIAATTPAWEKRFRLSEEPALLRTDADLEAAHLLVNTLAEHEEPVPLAELPSLLGKMSPAALNTALLAALRYLFLFVALKPDTAEPVIGLWPGIAIKLTGKLPPPPVSVAVGESFSSPFLMEDMVVILSSCAVEPIRLRSGDMRIFEAAKQNLVKALGTIPEWVEKTMTLKPELRIGMALEFLGHHNFLGQAGRPGADFRLEVTEAGAAWLAMESKRRLRVLLDDLKSVKKRDAPFYEESPLKLVPGLPYYRMGRDAERLVTDVVGALSAVPADTFIRMGDFMKYQVRVNNPFNVEASASRYFSVRGPANYFDPERDVDADVAWTGTMHGFVQQRLIPLGGVKLAIETGGNFVCFQITDVGLYLLGKGADFELPRDVEARVLIQPNFEVVFMSPSARTEAEFARFCERVGRHVGTLFRITKTSILTAAAAGVTNERVDEILREHCKSTVPGNVKSEIAGWFKRYREIRVREALVINCPDVETAARVKGMLGNAVSSLSDTALELHDTKFPTATAKKLRELGIFVRS